MMKSKLIKKIRGDLMDLVFDSNYEDTIELAKADKILSEIEARIKGNKNKQLKNKENEKD